MSHFGKCGEPNVHLNGMNYFMGINVWVAENTKNKNYKNEI